MPRLGGTLICNGCVVSGEEKKRNEGGERRGGEVTTGTQCPGGGGGGGGGGEEEIGKETPFFGIAFFNFTAQKKIVKGKGLRHVLSHFSKHDNG